MADKPQGTTDYDINMPDGSVVTLKGVPDGTSPQDIRAAVERMRGSSPQPKPIPQPKPVAARPNGLNLLTQGPSSQAGALPQVPEVARETMLALANKMLPGGENMKLEFSLNPRKAFEAAKMVGEGMLNLASRGGEAMTVGGFDPLSGRPTQGRREAMAEGVEDMFRPGFTGDALTGSRIGNVGGELLNLVMGAKSPRAASGMVAAEKAATKAAAKATFKQAMTELPGKAMKALKPSIAIRKQFSEVAPQAFEDVVSFAKDTGSKLESMGDMAKVNHGIRERILEMMNKITGQGISLDGDAIAKQLRKFKGSYDAKLIDKATGKPVSVTQPGVSAADFAEIDRAIELFEGKMVPLDVAENFRRGVNARLASFMRKNDIRKGQELKSNPGTAGNSALIDILASETDAALAKIKSPQMTPLRKRYSNNRVLDDAVTERIIREMTEEEVGFFDFQSLDTITFGSAFTAAATGNLPAAGVLGLTGGARRVIDVISDRIGKPDAQIQRAFKGIVDNENVPSFKVVNVPERKLLTGRTDLQGPFEMGRVPGDSPAFGSGPTGAVPLGFGSTQTRLLPGAGQTSGPTTVAGRSQFGIELPREMVPMTEPPSVRLQLKAAPETQAPQPSSTAFRKGPADIGPDAPLEARLDQMLGLNRPPRPENVRVVGGNIEIWDGKKWKAIAELK